MSDRSIASEYKWGARATPAVFSKLARPFAAASCAKVEMWGTGGAVHGLRVETGLLGSLLYYYSPLFLRWSFVARL